MNRRYERECSGGFCRTGGEPVTSMVFTGPDDVEAHRTFGDRLDSVRPCGHDEGVYWHESLAALTPEERVEQIEALLANIVARWEVEP